MPTWQFATGLSLTLLVALTVHVFYRRPPGLLWPSLPMVIASGLVFALGDLMAEVWADSSVGLWLGMSLLYIGLFSMSTAWWEFSGRYAEIYEPEIWARLKRFPWIPTRVLIGMNVVFVSLMATSSWHGLFLDPNPGSRSTYGPIWYVAATVNYLAVMSALSVQIALSFMARNRPIRSQCRYMAAAILAPLAANVIFVSTPIPLPYDPTALGMAVSCSLLLFAASRLDLWALERLSVPDILSDDMDAILFIRSDYRLLYANDRASRLMGEKHLVRGTTVNEIFSKKIPSFCLDEVLKVCFEGQRPIVGGAHHLFNSAGRDQWIQIDVTRFRWHRGRSIGFCIRLRDRTELHEANVAMEDHAILLEAIDKATGEGLVVQDAMGRIRYANEAFARLWDIPVSELNRWGHEKLISEVGNRLWGNSGAAFKTVWSAEGEQFDLDFRLTADVQMVDGRIMEVCTFPIKPAETFSGRVWRTTDVTQQRQDAQAMIHSQKLKGLGVLAGGIAHDFNNLLAAMLGNAELARESAPPDSPVLEYLEDVEASAQRATELTSQMLAYTGKASYAKESVNLSELIRDAGELLAVSISKNIRMDYRIGEAVPLIEGGLGQLRQIAMNLVTNAADAIGESRTGCIEIETGLGRPELLGFSTASVSYGSMPKTPVFLRVLDNGEGMDQDTLNRIFDPFFTTKISGRGLGLAATLGIIQSHGASLCVESRPGEGTSFTVFFPAAAQAKKIESVCSSLPESLPFSSQTALVVDDEVSVREMLKKMLATVDVKVLEASDGHEAIDVYEENSADIDFVILDMNMPGMDGEATWWSLRERAEDLPILLSSGYPEQMVNLEGARSAEVDGFIQKPYRKRDLMRQLALLMNAPRQAQD